MTQRKPEGMDQRSWVDEQVEAAMRRGDFDNLPGAGKPIPNVADNDPDWWIKSLAAREGINLASPLLEARREVERLMEGLGSLTDERAVREAVDRVNRGIVAAVTEDAGSPLHAPAPLRTEWVMERWRLLRQR